MPPKGKTAHKPKATDASKLQQPSPSSSSSSSATPATSTTTKSKPQSHPQQPTTVAERSAFRQEESRPFEGSSQDKKKIAVAALPRDQQTSWFALRFARSSPAVRAKLHPKAQRELWRHVNEGSLPLRTLGRGKKEYDWCEQVGRFSLERFDEWTAKRTALTCLEVASLGFKARREQERKGLRDSLSGEPVVVTESEVSEEKKRRREMAALRKELYGTVMGKLEGDPEWDDVVPIPQEEPEGALATISYPQEYAEAISYLRAVMVKKEYSPRCLRLTEHIIGMNPAHYTVWLYRAANIFAMKLPIPDEIEWLNGVALEYLKNYQIWHHRHLLLDNYYPTIADDPEAVARLAASERSFIAQILAEDTKNYHVWSYRSYLIEKLKLWGSTEELAAIEEMIDDDVRNNSAWSHRFFLVFSDPSHSTPGVPATERDPAAPSEIVDREIAYARAKIALAPQNQSPWNYLRGVLVKGGRKLSSVESFVEGFITGLGKEGEEDVKSTHALDLLAEIYAEKGDKEKADLCLKRLGEKWDQIRKGYWEWRRKCLETGT